MEGPAGLVDPRPARNGGGHRWPSVPTVAASCIVLNSAKTFAPCRFSSATASRVSPPEPTQTALMP